MRVATLLLGMVLLALGLAGFVPAFVTDGKLFGLLPENMILSGLMALTGMAGILIATLKRPDFSASTRSAEHDLRSWM